MAACVWSVCLSVCLSVSVCQCSTSIVQKMILVRENDPHGLTPPPRAPCPVETVELPRNQGS